MTEEEIFESAVRSRGDLAGVFEYDGETSYFYLFKTGQKQEIIDSVHVASTRPDFTSSDVEIRWTQNGEKVGLMIRGELWAVFDTERGTKHGGNYRSGRRPNLEPGTSEGFICKNSDLP